MDDVRFGSLVRALRLRRGWRQVDLAKAAGAARVVVTRIERGRMDRLRLRDVRRVLASLEVGFELRPRWQGGDLDRLADAGHAMLVERLARSLGRTSGWTWVPEVSFNIYGERGSIDLLGWHPVTGSLLVVEAKTQLTDLQQTLATLDRKRRLAPRIAGERGWAAQSVGVVLAVTRTRTTERRIAAHRTTLRSAFPDNAACLVRWLRSPGDPLAALISPSYVPTQDAKATTVRRMRRRNSKSAPRDRHLIVSAHI